MSCAFRDDVGVYVLGALAPAERTRLEDHARTCAECTATLREFQGLPGLLSRVSESDLEPGPDDASEGAEVPPGLLSRVEVRARRARRRRAVLVAAAAVVVLVLGVLIGRALPDPSGTTVEAAPTRTLTLAPAVATSPVFGEASLVARPWGTAIELRCRTSAAGGPVDTGPRPVYVLTVTGSDGSTSEVARWSPPPGQDADVSGAVDLMPQQVSRLAVRTETGQVVLAS